MGNGEVGNIELEGMNVKQRKQKLEKVSGNEMNGKYAGSENHCLP